MSCYKCGQANIADGGIGCVCGKCQRCNELTADETGFCFLCRPCKKCGSAMEMHTFSMMDKCCIGIGNKNLIKELDKLLKFKG